MADLLLELFSEEIPARMQAQAAKDLERLVVGALSDRGLLFEGAKAFAGPRRLTLAIAGLPAKQPDVSEELKGPKVDAPQAALDGFLRKTGLTKDQLKVEKTPKGDVYLAVIERAGRATADVLSEILPECFAKLPWPKSMRFPDSPVRWVRPLHGIVCMFDGEVVPFEFAGVTSGNTTKGHRFLSSGTIEVRHYDDYVEKLHKAHVVLDAEERKAIIFEAVKSAAFVHGLEMIPDEGLLDEVAGLAEWPVVLIGAIQDEFMDVPPEILQTSMRTHQKYFSLRDPKTGKMANRFALVANMIAEDGGKEIVAGNERVLRARLSDAKFFWGQDRKRTLESRVEDLKNIVFHAKLGTQYERVQRIVALAGEIAAKIGADVEKAKRAALLCKADLTSGVVGEFPELQGVMGRYYALHDGEDADVADAARDHYKPVGPSDTVPTNRVAVAVALSDKIDILTGFFGVDEKPTGSKDPFALRRAALGLVRIVLTNALRVPISAHAFGDLNLIEAQARAKEINAMPELPVGTYEAEIVARETLLEVQLDKLRISFSQNAHRIAKEVGDFAIERLRVQLRDMGTSYDVVDAVLARAQIRSDGMVLLPASLANNLGTDDILLTVARAEALRAFLKTDDGANLLVAYRRAANILRDEEKRDKINYDDNPNLELLVAPEERMLFVDLATASEFIRAEVERERFVEAMGVMAKLRAPVDAFFDKVTVNDKDAKLRENRLKLLARLRATLHQVADFSKIEG